MIALSDIIILTVSGALLVVALMRAYSPDNPDSQQNTTGQVQQPTAASNPPLSGQDPVRQAQTGQGQTGQGQTTPAQTGQGQTGQVQNSTAAVTTGTNTTPADTTAQTTAQPAGSGTSQSQQPVAENPGTTPEIVLESYTVQSGDSLSLIASRTGTSVQELQAINRLTSTVIQIGQVLRYPAP